MAPDPELAALYDRIQEHLNEYHDRPLLTKAFVIMEVQYRDNEDRTLKMKMVDLNAKAISVWDIRGMLETALDEIKDMLRRHNRTRDEEE